MKLHQIVVAIASIAFVHSASAQDEIDVGALLMSPADIAGGTCTCNEMTPPPAPFDCDEAVREIRQSASTQVGAMTGECVTQQMQRCIAQQGGQACEQLPEAFRAGCNPAIQGRLACASLESDIEAQCSEAIDAMFERDVGPVLRQQRAVCEAQNAEALAPWTQWCEEVERPQACGACTGMTDEIAALEAELAGHREWIAEMRTTELLTTSGDDDSMTERLAEVDRLEDQLAQRQANYDVMRSTGYCD